MSKQFDTLVLIGRMQPFHIGHKAVVDKALEYAKEVVIVLGSCFQPRSTKNPFTFEERKAMIESCYPRETDYYLRHHRVKVVPVMDYPYDDNAWVSAVQSAVNNVKYGDTVGLIGHSKDHTSYYLKIFPDWRNHVEVENVDCINATDIREELFEGNSSLAYSTMPAAAFTKMQHAFITSSWFSGLYDEYHQIKEYREKSQMKGFNFPSVFVTTDAVITQSGYILLIKRGGFPFKDCWALPGGYLDKGQFIVDNMIKELREETKLKVPDKVLKGSIKGIEVFDHPDRDPRGRTITHGFHIDLGFPDEKLPKVKGADDAKHAEWVKLSDVTSEMMAFDHYHIIKRFIPTYGK
jgi:bifunctional NMN adenylyltransferase/nudix hydrolase